MGQSEALSVSVRSFFVRLSNWMFNGSTSESLTNRSRNAALIRPRTETALILAWAPRLWLSSTSDRPGSPFKGWPLLNRFERMNIVWSCEFSLERPGGLVTVSSLKSPGGAAVSETATSRVCVLGDQVAGHRSDSTTTGPTTNFCGLL